MGKDTPLNASNNFGVANIRTFVPLNLDLDELNYDSWRELFETHCMSFDLMGHLDGSSKPTADDDKDWKKIDSLIKLWIYGTLSKPLLQYVVKRKYIAHQLWEYIENLFRNNKDSREMELENELRNITLGNSSITEYCRRIQTIADLLENIDSNVSDKNLVAYMLNGLPEKYDNTIEIITYKVLFPTFLEARSMLLLAEKCMNNRRQPPTPSHTDNSSSPTILYTDGNRGGTSGGKSRLNQGKQCGGNRGNNGGTEKHQSGQTNWNKKDLGNIL
ncbi:uncharacterized protein [Rutidosis leptorrhynchoides]|uniref:uncharacterized protein n=1 Tax=Rutidosis leptorrhynchoides TaxID=125765 RepID=UPI003A99AE36